MKFTYDKSKSQSIINHENIMLETSSKIIDSYSSLFEQYDCSLNVSLFWFDFSTDVCRSISVIRVMYVVKFSGTAKKYK